MANEVNDGNDKVERINRGDRTSENTADDGVIGGDRKDHQQIHQEASKAGHTFDTFSDNSDDQSFKAIQPVADVFGIDFGDGTVETSKGIISNPTTQDAFEQKGQEILVAAQRLKPSSADSIPLGGQSYEPDQLIAANVTDFYNPNDLISRRSEFSDVATDATNATDRLEQTVLERWNSGEPLTVREFLDLPPGASPIVDAYRASLAHNEGEPGKSKTLEHVIFRLQSCPWADDIRVVRNSSKAEKDYSPGTKTIEIGGALSAPRQIETFAHEAYHASHRDLFGLYLDPSIQQNLGGMATLDDYRNARFGAEVKAFETEIKINQELTSKMPGSNPITMAVLKKGPVMGVQVPMLWEKDTIDRPDLCELYVSEGISGLWRFLRDEKPVRINANGKAVRDANGYVTETPYGNRYDKQYKDWYKPNFVAERAIAEQMRQRFLDSGHTLAEFEDWGY